MSRCRGCNAEILWIVTQKGKTTCVDAKPERRYIIQQMVKDERGNEVPLMKMEQTYMAHHATCPKAAQFRKPKEKKDASN